VPNQSQNAVTPEDVRSFGEKLEEFSRGLPPGEQAVLSWLIQRAAMLDAGDTLAQGYAIVMKKRSGTAEGGLPFELETTWAIEGSQA
jgi:hypothetical protein